MLSPVGYAPTERSASGKRFLDAQAAQLKLTTRRLRATAGLTGAAPKRVIVTPVPISRSTAAAFLFASTAHPVFNASSPVPALGASNPIAVVLAA